MSSVWAFLGGASNELLNQRKQAQEDERVRAEYDRRMKAQQEFQRAAEEAARKNRILASGLDRKTGELYEVTASGEDRRTKAPQAMLDDANAADAAATAKAEREERKFAAELMSKGASAEAAKAQAQASLAGIARGNARLPGQIALDTARAEKAKREAANGGAKPPSESDKRQAAQAAAVVSDSIIGRTESIENAELKSVIEEARREALQETDVIKRLELLREVEALVAAQSKTKYTSPPGVSSF